MTVANDENKKISGLIRRYWIHFKNDSLFRNSFYILFSTAIISVTGFLFWFLAARLYNSEQVGVVGALISACALIMSIGSLGINHAFIRYIPNSKNKQEIINSGTILVTISTLLVTICYILLLPIVSPKLNLITANLFFTIFFILLAVITSLNSLIDSIFIASRTAHYNMTTYSVFGISKIILLLFFVGFGASGLFFSHTIGIALALIIGFFIIQKKLHLKLKFQYDQKIIKKMFKFSGLIYLISLIGGIPNLVLPLVIIQILGASQAAYFYMAMMIATLIFAIPNSVTSALFAEGSHDSESIGIHFKKAALLIIPSLFGVIIITMLLGHQVLSVFGKDYAVNGYWPLVWLSVSSIFIGFNALFSTILKIKKRLRGFLIINFLGTLFIVIASYFTIEHGLTNVALSWLGGQAFMSICFYAGYLRDSFRQNKTSIISS